MARTAVRNRATDQNHTQPEFVPLTDEHIAAQTDSGSFSRGKTYFRGGRIFAGVRRQSTLRARCYGSSGGPYVVEATLATTDGKTTKNPVSFACNCPRGGFCKHVVALLLTWIDNPETFDLRPPLAEVLAAKSQDELIGLIEQMLRFHPEMEQMLELPVPVTGTLSDDPVDEAAIRRQIAVAMKDDRGQHHYNPGYRYDYDYRGYHGFHDDEDYEVGSRVAAKLEPLIELAEQYAAAGIWRNALAVAATFAEEVAPQLETFDDESGDLDLLVSRADVTLAACLDAQGTLPPDQQLTAAERRRLIDTIFLIWQTDVESAGLDLSLAGPEAIGRNGTPEEQRAVAEQVRAVMRTEGGTSWDPLWHKRAAIGFLSILSGDAGFSNEELLTEYRDAELWEEAAHLLVQMGRVEEAIPLAARHLTAADVLLAFADQVLASGHPQCLTLATTLVDDRLWEREGQNVRDDQALRAWLEQRYAELGQSEKALAMARARFDAAPDRTTYDAVKLAAQLPGLAGNPWPAQRKKIIDTLRKRGDWFTLIDIFLAEEEVAAAIEALEQSEKASRSGRLAWGFGWSGGPHDYATRVAAAAETGFPDASIAIYRRLADQKIAARQRPSYQEAAKHLFRVKHVLEAAGRDQEWPPLISDLRQQNKTLRALREELDALGLG
jgi:uncharacterized Zn finger protein